MCSVSFKSYRYEYIQRCSGASAPARVDFQPPATSSHCLIIESSDLTIRPPKLELDVITLFGAIDSKTVKCLRPPHFLFFLLFVGNMLEKCLLCEIKEVGRACTFLIKGGSCSRSSPHTSVDLQQKHAPQSIAIRRRCLVVGIRRVVLLCSSDSFL